MNTTTTATRTGRYDTVQIRTLKVGDYVHSGNGNRYLKITAWVSTTPAEDTRGNRTGDNVRFEVVNDQGKPSYYDGLAHYRVPAFITR
jgi:hypothetical protein